MQRETKIKTQSYNNTFNSLKPSLLKNFNHTIHRNGLAPADVYVKYLIIIVCVIYLLIYFSKSLSCACAYMPCYKSEQHDS